MKTRSEKPIAPLAIDVCQRLAGHLENYGWAEDNPIEDHSQLVDYIVDMMPEIFRAGGVPASETTPLAAWREGGK
jgi:hypothetical protein